MSAWTKSAVNVGSVFVLIILFTWLGYGFWRTGPWDSVSTGTKSWPMMEAEGIVLADFPMLYDVYYNGMSIQVGDQLSSTRWVGIEIYSKGGVKEAWIYPENLQDAQNPQLKATPNRGNILEVFATYGPTGSRGKNRWTITLPGSVEEAFTLYAENNRGMLYSVNINPSEIIDPIQRD